MWNQRQDPTPQLFSYQSLCHHPSRYFFEAPPMQVSSLYIHQPLIIHFLINDLLLSKFIQARHTDGGIRAKNNLFVHCDGVFDGFFKLFLCFHTVSTRYIQVLTVMSYSFIISFVSPGRLQKSFGLLFTPPKYHHHHHSTCYIVNFLHWYIYSL